MSAQFVTADEFLRMNDDSCRTELRRGVIHKRPFNGMQAGALIANLAMSLWRYAEVQRGFLVAATGFQIAENPDTVLAPDIAFVRKENMPEEGVPEGYFPGVPDLAVEVVSPNDRVYEVDDKADKWLDAGAQLVWIVNPKRRTIEVRTTSGSTLLGVNGELSGENAVPGFTCRVADIFA